MLTNTSDSHTTYNENYKTLTEKNKQLHKHAKHFGWKFREAHFQAKQVLTQLTCDSKFTHKVAIKSRNMQWYIKVQYTEADYKTKVYNYTVMMD